MAQITWSAQLLGAFLSGLVGVALFLFKSQFDQRREKLNWFDDAWRLVTQLKDITPDEYVEFYESGEFDETVSGFKKERLQRDYDHLHESLRQHAMDAPTEVDDEVITRLNRLAGRCYKVRQTQRTSDTFPEIVRDVIRDVRWLRSNIPKARGQVGWLS